MASNDHDKLERGTASEHVGDVAHSAMSQEWWRISLTCLKGVIIVFVLGGLHGRIGHHILKSIIGPICIRRLMILHVLDTSRLGTSTLLSDRGVLLQAQRVTIDASHRGPPLGFPSQDEGSGRVFCNT